MAYYDRLTDRLDASFSGGAGHDEALSIGRRSVPHSSRAELWRRSGSDPPEVHEHHGGRHRSDPRL